jgi:opacity protein-like surface antigen
VRRFQLIVAALAATAFMASGAMAADVVMPSPTIVAAPSPPPMAAPAFDWNRLYAGVYAGSWITCCGFMGGGFAGKNFNNGGRMVFGIEGMAGVYQDGGYSFEAYLLGRLGILFGTRVLLYGSLGAAYDTGNVVPAAAAGVEVALRSSASLRAQVLFYDAFNAPEIAVNGGFAWHFGGH